MTKGPKILVLAIALIGTAFAIGLAALPSMIPALPGVVRVRLANVPFGESLLDLGATPLPAVLPAPSGAVARAEVVAIPTAVAPTTELLPLVTAGVKAASEGEQPAASATPNPTETPLPSPTATPTRLPLPPRARIDGLEIVAQGFNNCGPANLTMNLGFYGDETTQANVASFLKPNSEDRNVSPWQMVDYVNEQTSLRAYIGSGGNLDLIKRLIASGYPVVIEKGYELEREGWLGHYLTVFGYDDETEEMVSLDTNLGPWDGSGRYDSYEEVEKYWQQFNRTFFVVYPPEKEEELFNILGPRKLDAETMWQDAAQQAETEIDNDSQNAFAWFNLGTSLTRLGELSGEIDFYQDGAAAFDQAFILGVPPRIMWYQFRPYIAYLKTERYQDMIDLADAVLDSQGGRNVEETYLYKGHALAFLGDGSGAVDGYRQALRLNENFYPAQWALDSISQGN